MTHKVLKSAIAAAGIDDFIAAVQAHLIELQLHAAHMARVRADEALPPLPQQPRWEDKPRNLNDEADCVAFNREVADWELLAHARHAPYPEPITHPDIHSAIKRVIINADTHFVPDYEIINDDPSADAILASKKNTLLSQITEAENTAVARVLPPARRRHYEYMLHDVSAADEQRINAVREQWDKQNGALQALDAKRAEALAAVNTLEADDKADDKQRARAKRDLSKLDDPHAALAAETTELLSRLQDPENKIHGGARPPADQAHLDRMRDMGDKINAIARAAAHMHYDVDHLTLENIDTWVMPALPE